MVVQPDAISEQDAQRVLGQTLSRETRAWEILRRPDVEYDALVALPAIGGKVADPRIAEQVDVQAKYAGYIGRQKDEIAKLKSNEARALPESLDYAAVKGLSAEVRQKFADTRPETIAQAARIPGVTPAAISLLLVHLKKRA